MAESERFSTAYAQVPHGSIPAKVSDAIRELSVALGGVTLSPVRWNDEHVAVSFDVPVDLPTRGPVDGIDIRPVEPVLVVFHLRNYPVKAPSAYSDRQDFPAARLPHLNPTRRAHPFSLCLHRGSIDDWFAEHTLADFAERIRSWLRDAAAGRLMREGDYFEHTRMSEAEGVSVFDPDKLEWHVQRSWDEAGGAAGHAYFHARASAGKREASGWSSQFAMSLDFLIGREPGEEQVKLVAKWNGLPPDVREHEWWALGLLLWPAKVECDQYFGYLPGNYGELVEFAETIGIALQDAVGDYIRHDAKRAWCIPLTLAVLRPRPLLGTSSAVEWLSFVVVGDDEDWLEDGKPKNQLSVYPLAHRRPLTPEFAAELSGRGAPPAPLTSPLIIGAGAVGSRVALHLAKAGSTDQLVVDNGTLSPHHMVRHGLLSRHLGKNKAEALKQEIIDLYGRPTSSKPTALERSAFDALRNDDILKERTLVIDASASPSVMNALVQANLKVPACRVEIADGGKLGICSYEAANRNPRVDDLQTHLWGLGLTEDLIAEWLGRHREEVEGTRGPALEEIGIGIGCSSATMRLGDDVVAFHSSQFAMAVRQIAAASSASGAIRISRLINERALACFDIDVPPVRILRARNEYAWTVRMAHAVDRGIKDELHRAGKRETGGLLLGYVHRKRGTAYVTAFLKESADSVGTQAMFVRGVEGYADQIRHVERRTGGLIGYVGEWHTHPAGKPEPSRRDLGAMDQSRAVLAPAGMPTIMVIASQRGTKAFVHD